MNSKLPEIIEYLQGSCHDLEATLEMFETTFTQEDYEALDAEIFQCDLCGWWWEHNDMSDEDWICRDCADE